VGKVIINPTIAANIKLINEIQIVVQRPPIKNSIFDNPCG
jgi:hypothetical protein